MIVAAGLAVAIVTTFTIDLGPGLRLLAEREGSRRIQRPMHIGSLSVRLFDGRFALEDFVIEGLEPEDRPFLRAKRVDVSLAWQALLRQEVLLDSIEMSDWQMVVETWPGDRHNLPKFTSGSDGPRRFVTTMQYVRAQQGEFTYLDHGAPWSTIARNLDLTVSNVVGYRGEASFTGGTITIQDYVPMSADMKAVFKIEGGNVHFDRINLVTDGAESVITGDADIAHWPEQTYQVRSTVQFPRMREIFFAKDTYSLFGVGRFDGVFHIYKGGRSLTGQFESDLAGVNDWRFPALKGALVWLPDRFEVTEATTQFYGGTTRLRYVMAPLGRPNAGAALEIPVEHPSAAAAVGTPVGRPHAGTATFDAEYLNVDLAALSDFFGWEGLRFAGRATGTNRLEWPLGRYRERHGEGRIDVTRPTGEPSEEQGEPHPALGHLPIAGQVTYTFDPNWWELADGRFTTFATDVTFSGRTSTSGDDTRIPFHVTSADLQESDRVLAGIMTAFGSRTGTVSIGGSGDFDGVMLEAFRAPRVEATFKADNLRAFDVDWGTGQGQFVLQNAYADITNGRMQKDAGQVLIDGRFSMGFPRRDRGEELNTRIRIVSWPMKDLRHAFDIDDYEVDGTVSGEYHLYGRYQGPFGFGTMTILNGTAYGEPFERAAGALRFEGTGVRIDGLELAKGGGAVTGAAYLGWNGTYSFNADGRRLPMESVAAVAYPNAPLTGLMDFTVGGRGTFDMPRYDFRAQIRDLFVADEGIGVVAGRLEVRGTQMTVELDAASPRLAVSGSGRIALTPEADAELRLRFTDTSLDPYARAFDPRISPFTTAVGSGTLRVVGELKNPEHLLVDALFEQVQLRLFDYTLRNAAPIRLVLDQHEVRFQDMRLAGEGTQLNVSGRVDLGARRIAGTAKGSANLGILQGFYRNIRSSGQAELSAEVAGSLDDPVFFGEAAITGGRLRHFSLPNSIDNVNGRFLFDQRNIRLDGVTARVGQGQVNFDGRIGLDGYAPSELALTATGRGMQLRYPEGVRSVVDADLSLTGRMAAPVLGGSVTVQNATWTSRVNASGNLFDLAGSSAPAGPGAPRETIPLRLDVRVVAPGTLRIDNNVARISSSADLTIQGTYDRPAVFGRADIIRGEVVFEGRRYLVTRGTLSFSNPLRIEPLFDVEAETQVRVPGQTYRVTLRGTGTMQRFTPVFSSDPFLPEVDIVSLLFGDVATSRDADLRALQRPNATEQQLIQARAARLLVSPISEEVGRVVEEAFGVDTFQVTPLLGDPSQPSSRVNPSARLTIGKRISDRVYLTFARSLNAARDQIILLEYDQSNRISWILTRNEDDTYALDMRVRHEF